MNATVAIARDIDLAGARLTPDPSGALWWGEERLLIAADLHLEKGSAYAARGQMLPPYDTHATRLYNFFAMPTSQAQFCVTAHQVLAKATVMPPDSITSYAPVALAQIEAPFLRRSTYARR